MHPRFSFFSLLAPRSVNNNQSGDASPHSKTRNAMPAELLPNLTLALLGVVALVTLAVLIWLAVGLFNARSLVRREFAAYFVSPIAYVVLVVFLAVTGRLFALTFDLLTTTGPK